METQKIRVRGDIKLPDVIRDLGRGKLKIPPFQRQYVWEKTRVRDLLDSIYKEFPIGTFFIWSAPSKYKKFFKDIEELKLPQPHQYENIDFILDGQQRIISLYAVINGMVIEKKDYSQICFDLERREFVIRSRPSSHQIPVYKMFDEKNPFKIYEELKHEHREPYSNCYNIFKTYPFSVVSVVEKDLPDAIKIFERINQGGKKLSLFDLVAASTWSVDFDLRRKFDELKKYFAEKGYGEISPESVLFALGLCIKGHAKNKNLLEMTSNEVKVAWEDVVESMKLAVDYLSNNQGVKIFAFLPYPVMLPLLTYFYYQNNKKSLTKDQSENIHKWFWKSALAERYASTVQSYLEEDRKKVMDRILQKKEPKLPFSITLSPEKIKESRLGVKSALRNSFFCLLSLKEPRNFKNGEKITLDNCLCSKFNDSNKHHIFPAAYLKRYKIDNFNSLANFCFIPSQLNKEISDKKPSDYFSKYKEINPNFEKTLKTHLIPDGSFIENNNYDEFLNSRSNLIFDELQKLAEEQFLLEGENESVDSLENSLRNFIHEILTDKSGGLYWKENVPQDIQNIVSKKIKTHTRQYPNENIDVNDERVLISFLDIMDYFKIISSNSKYFEEIFPSMKDLEENFRKFKEYRNVIKHNREMTSIIRKNGEASMEWLWGFIKNYYNKEDKQKLKSGDVSSDKYLICGDKDVEAKAKLSDDNKIKVLKGSTAHGVDAPAFKNHNYKKLRDRLINEGVLEKKKDHFSFSRDYEFSSSSAAAAVVLARSAAGPSEWKTKEGIKLSELDR
ncbi:MAG: DUF4357 domain-containing protein [Candidatus Muiribacteriota bacterium]